MVETTAWVPSVEPSTSREAWFLRWAAQGSFVVDWQRVLADPIAMGAGTCLPMCTLLDVHAS